MERTFSFSTASEIIQRRPIRYGGLEGEDLLHVPPQGSFLAKSFALSPRAAEFRVAQERNVTLVGADTYFTARGTYFTDEQLANPASIANYLKRLSRGEWQGLSARVDGEDLTVDMADDPIVIDQPVLSLASLEPSNYGSWLFRFIPKLIDVDFRDRPILVYYNSARWMKGLFAFFHGDREFIHHASDKQYSLNDVIIPSCRNADVFFDTDTRDFYRDRIQPLLGDSYPERVYLSRQSRQSIRPIVNETELIAQLEDIGFAIIRPEELPYETQYAIIANARVLVCPGGSGLFNMVFAARAEFVVDIEPGPEWLFPHHNVLRSCQIPHAIAIGSREDPAQPHGPWKVNVEDIIAVLRSVG